MISLCHCTTSHEEMSCKQHAERVARKSMIQKTIISWAIVAPFIAIVVVPKRFGFYEAKVILKIMDLCVEAKQKRPDDEFTPGSPSNASVDDFPLRFFAPSSLLARWP